MGLQWKFKHRFLSEGKRAVRVQEEVKRFEKDENLMQEKPYRIRQQ